MNSAGTRNAKAKAAAESALSRCISGDGSPKEFSER